ncbi:MAG: hypothetical protein Q4F41_17620 [Eubacteriales bacterium]|nr:hypothetical protein [Eubacteriales bacterium]
MTHLKSLLLALLFLLPAATATAETTRLQTTVPSTHTLTLDCGPGGSLRLDGQTYTGTVTLTLPRFGDAVIELLPDAGYELSSCIADPADGTTQTETTLTISGIYQDKTVTVRFTNSEEPSESPTEPSETPTEPNSETSEPITEPSEAPTEPTTEPSTSTPSATAQTGDPTPLTFWLLLFGASAFLLLFLFSRRTLKK